MTSKATRQKATGKRTATVRVRFNAEELQRLDALRKRLGYRSRSAMIRDLPEIARRGGKGHKAVVVDRAALVLAQEVERLRGEVRAVGVNLNQAVKQVHRGGSAANFLMIPLSDARDELKAISERLDALEAGAITDGR